jgi:hypothetical protein
MDAIRWWPLLAPDPYPNSSTLAAKRYQRMDAERMVTENVKGAEKKLCDLELELYQKVAQTNVIRLEILKIGKIDVYV